MSPAARLQALLEMLQELDQSPSAADSLISRYFRARRYMGSGDRGYLSGQVYAILRHQARLGWWLDHLGFPSTPRLRLLVWQRLGEKESARALDKLFSGEGKFAPSPLDAGERKLLEALEGRTLHHPSMPENVRVECPDWAERGLRARFGPRFGAEMEALLAPAALDIRINPFRTRAEEVETSLRDAGLSFTACAFAPGGYRIAERPDLNRLSLLKNGAIEIQDEGSQLVAQLVDAQPGARVVDFCAGAGGKTLAIAAQMANRGRVIACDVLANRLKKAALRFRRAGLHNIEIKALESERDPWIKRHKESFDRVLVDAPCSGTGTWRRNPDQRWRRLGPDLAGLIALQAGILDSAARLVRKGGRLVYATCSLLPEENERQVERFLNDHPAFAVVDLEAPENASLLPRGPRTGAFLALAPAQHGTDGFFGAVLTRRT